MPAVALANSPTFTARCLHMARDDRPWALRYAIPLGAVAAATFFASLLPWRVDPSHFTLYFLAVMVSAWYGGFGAGLLSTVLSAAAIDYFFILPIHSIELDWHALARTSVFLAVAAVTNFLTTARRRAEAGLRQAQAQLEDRVRERTAELAKANEALQEEIIERKKIEAELLRIQHHIGRVERLATLGRITATVAHDLGTPLNSVLGYAQLLAQDELPERSRRRLAIIETQIHRMVEIIQRYLSYTRSAPAQKAININELIKDTLLLLQPVFKQRGVAMTTQLDASAPIVHGDANSIQRVLINLLDNSLDACSNGGAVTIATTVENVEAQGRGKGITLRLIDNGIGIPSDILPKVFDLFVTTKEPGKGTGLGLVICQEIIKAHGGTISIASESGKGTTVALCLPAQATTAEAAEDRNEPAHIDS